MAKRVYKASDGSSYTTKADAEKRESVVAAIQELKDASEKVGLLLAEGAMSADGKPFEPGKWREYWHLVNFYGQWPKLEKIDLYPYYVSVELERNDPAILLRVYENQSRGSDYGNYRTFRINELYLDESAARAALIAAWETHIADATKRLAEVKAKVTIR